MILPSKYENIKENGLIVGAYIISFLKNSDLTLLEIHLQLKKYKNLELAYSYLLDILTFLYISDIIVLENNLIKLKYDSQ